MRSVSSRLRGIWHAITHYRVENAGIKVLAVALASLLFIISRQPLSEVRIVGVQLEYRGLAEGLEMSGDVHQTVSVRVRGPRDVVRNIMPNQIAVVANLNGKDPGDRVIQLRTSDVSRPEDIDVLQIDPGTIRLRIESTTHKRVKVEPELIGSVRHGFEVYHVTVQPSMVEIQGPESEVAKVDSVSTESVQLVDRTSNFGTAVDIDHPNPTIRVVTTGPINLWIEVGEGRIARILEIPVRWVDQTPRGRLLTPHVTVEVFGPRSVVESMRADQVYAELRTGSLSPQDELAVPRVVLPPAADAKVTVKGVNPAQVRFKREISS